ncbi:LOW QUALITY PROTEIN: glucokinase regulatory protein [Xenentodon cancila]
MEHDVNNILAVVSLNAISWQFLVWRVCYLGWDSLALVGLIDARECNPKGLDTNEGPLTSLGPEFCIAHEDFLHVVLPCLTDRDTVVLIYTHSGKISLFPCADFVQIECTFNEVVQLARRVKEKTCNLRAVSHQTDRNDAAALQDEINRLCLSTLHFTWPQGATASESLLHMQWELSTKLVLNAVSAGAHVLKGKTYQNYMIDVQVTNCKLYCRTTRLLYSSPAEPPTGEGSSNF